MVAMIRNSVGREHSSRAIRLSTSIGVRRFARIEWSWKMRSNSSTNQGYFLAVGTASLRMRASMIFLTSEDTSVTFRRASSVLLSVMLWRASSRVNSRSFSLPATCFATARVMDFQTQTGHSPCICVLDAHQSLTPALGQHGGPFADTLRVVAEELMEVGALADAPIYQIGQLRVVQREQICFGRHEQRRAAHQEIARGSPGFRSPRSPNRWRLSPPRESDAQARNAS